MKKLIGRQINSISINEEKDLIVFTFKEGPALYLSAVGDCCSRSWFEHLSGVEVLTGHTIVEVVERAMPQENRDDWNCVQFYGWTLVTNRGRADLEMRNESNGYYGGWVEVSIDPLDQYRATRDGFRLSTVLEDF